LKIPPWENMFFGKKDPEKDNSPKCKENTLVHYMSFGPINDMSLFRRIKDNPLVGVLVSEMKF
jgi:hypothetical protein